MIRERGLGATDTKARDYTSDVTTDQQKALSGGAKQAGQKWSNRRLDRRPGDRPKEVTDVASSAVREDSSDEAASSATANQYNSSAQFADSSKLQSQEAGAAAAKSMAARNRGGLLKQVGTKGLEGSTAASDSAVGAQRAAQKFKLSSGKVLFCPEAIPPASHPALPFFLFTVTNSHTTSKGGKQLK